MLDFPCPRRSLEIFLLQLTVCSSMLAQVNVTTYHNDNARTGQNTKETTLTTANVNTSAFGRLFSIAVDGQVYAQPLLLSNVNIGGGTHDVVYVATESDSVYAIDANNGTVYWKRTLLYNGGVPINVGDFGFNNNITPHYGITGTPVIDTSANTLYLVASSKESGSVAVHRLHALDTGSGADKPGAYWVVVGGSYGGVTFNPAMQFNRPALLLNGTHVIVAFGQHSNSSAYGWLFSYKNSNLALEAVYNTNPGTVAGSIWMSGNGVAGDSSGNMYFATGDGPWNGSTWFGDSILKMGPPTSGNFPRLDYFTPWNQSSLEEDIDLGSGGVLLLPDLTGSSHPHLLVQAGKDGVIHLVNRDNMGQFCSTCNASTGDTNILQELHALLGLWGSPAYWNGNVYFSSGNDSGASDTLKAYSLNAGNSGVLSNTPTSQTPEAFGFSQPTPSVSSNGPNNGILWAIDNSSYASSCCAVLHAYNASNLTSELYSSNSIPWRDGLGGAVKFSVPTVANGKVYIGGNGQLAVFGLLPASLSPAKLLMGSRLQSDPPVSRNLTFSNTGSLTITITGMEVGTPFSVTGTTCGSTLAPGASCSITVTFSPADASIGVNTSVLTVSDSAVNSPQPAEVTGTMRCPSYGCL